MRQPDPVGNGSWAIYDTSQPYVVDNPLRTEHLIMMVPKQSIAERGLRLENPHGAIRGRQHRHGAHCAADHAQHLSGEPTI